MRATWLPDPASGPDTPLGVALGELASADPDRPALTCDGRTVTRGQLDARTNRLARAYAERGVTVGSFVAIGLGNGVEFFESLIATWKIPSWKAPVAAPAGRR